MTSEDEDSESTEGKPFSETLADADDPWHDRTSRLELTFEEVQHLYSCLAYVIEWDEEFQEDEGVRLFSAGDVEREAAVSLRDQIETRYERSRSAKQRCWEKGQSVSDTYGLSFTHAQIFLLSRALCTVREIIERERLVTVDADDLDERVVFDVNREEWLTEWDEEEQARTKDLWNRLLLVPRRWAGGLKARVTRAGGDTSELDWDLPPDYREEKWHSTTS